MKGFAFIDIKTTGNSPVLEKIFSISITTFNEKMRACRSYSTFVNPEKPLSKSQEETFGITNEELEHYPIFSEIADIVYGMVKGRNLGSFYRPRVSPLSFLTEELFYADIDFYYPHNKFIYVHDVEDIISERNVDNLIIKYTGLPMFKNDFETRRIGEIFKFQCEALGFQTEGFDYSKVAKVDGSKFEHILYDDDGDMMFNFGKYKGKKLKDVKSDYLHWMLEEDFSISVKERIKKILFESDGRDESTD